MSTLYSPGPRAVLEGLYAQAEANDAPIIASLRAEVKQSGRPFDDQERAQALERAFIPMEPEAGRLIHTLVRARRPELAVEFGASFGLSAIHIAAALKDNGHGRLITTEQNPHKAAMAREHIHQAGLGDWVEVRQGDAFETLTGVRGVEFLLLDGWKTLYLPLLRLLEPGLAPGAMVVADDLKIMPEVLEPYLQYVREPANGYVSSEIPLGDGLELSWKD